MDNDIIVKGILTNNLKNISVCLRKNAINLVIGPSGSGKSSLAYDTIAQIGLHELSSMYHDGLNEPEYKVQSFSNMVVTIPIKQLNSNNNVRSSIGTYFSLNPCLAKIFAFVLEMPYDYFVLNKSENVCTDCFGIGYTKQLDANKIIDYDKTLAEVPIRCWKKYKDFYKKIIELYCAKKGIDTNIKFRHLSEKQKNDILYGCSKEKFKVKYRVTNHESTRTTQYFGPLLNMPMLKGFSPSPEFFSEVQCKKCKGEKFEKSHNDYKVCGYSIGEIMIVPFEEITQWTKRIRENYSCEAIDFSLNKLESFAKKACELNLGHLFINRNIPSLSGGELQRLRLIQVFSSQLSDLLIVLDEPLAGLSGTEKKAVYDNVISLIAKHTLLIVDHHNLFLDVAKSIITLGKGGGKWGGSIINTAEYIEEQMRERSLQVDPIGKLIRIELNSCVYGYKGVKLDVAENRLNIITGASGVGKSTLLREYLPQFFDNYLYVNQKPMGGNVRSTVATNLEIANRIIQSFAKKFKKNKSFFSNITGGDGCCKSCAGTGQIIYGEQYQSQLFLICKDCKGTGFDKKLCKLKWDASSIQDIWCMTIDEACNFFKDKDEKIVEKLLLAQKLMLGHLNIGEKTSELSGGENIRMKLMKAFYSNKKIMGIDEPFKGLNNEEIYIVAKALKELVNQGKTIIVVDHEENSFNYFTKKIELVNADGILQGN